MPLGHRALAAASSQRRIDDVQVNARQTILVHGAREGRLSLAAKLATQGLACMVPSEGDSVTVKEAGATQVEGRVEE